MPIRGQRALPKVYLPATEAALPEVFLSEAGGSGAGARVKWLASTCLAGVVGVCLIGTTIYASLNVEDGSGVVNSLRRAGLAALQPVKGVRVASAEQSMSTRKADRIQVTSLGLSTRQIIHDTEVQKRGSREYIRIRSYARIEARLSTAEPPDDSDIPPFNPFKLYANQTPLADTNGGEADAAREVTAKVVELEGGVLPAEDGYDLTTAEVMRLVAAANEVYQAQPFAMRPAILADGDELPVRKAAYHPDDRSAVQPPERATPRNTTTVEKTSVEEAETVIEGSKIETIVVRRGDTLMAILERAGAEPWQAKAIADAMAPIFPAKRLKAGQEVRFTLVPAPSDSGQMEPVKVSLFTGDDHEVTVARNAAGEYVASDDPIDLGGAVVALRPAQYPQRASLYRSIYRAALAQKMPPDVITKLLRIHSYDTDYKQLVQAGDSFEVFFDVREEDGEPAAELGELLYTSITVDGETRRFYRFRTPDGIVDYYDLDGNSAKKFLMRKPVKGARFTSGFGMRKHPLLRYSKMHMGVDWAAPSGTPILAAGSGTVEEVGRKGGHGNYVRIRHANGYKTTYSHMSRFADGLRPGITLTQGQVIGYVGSTGLSSGPHLHFEILVNNRHVNPMSIHVPRGRKLADRLLVAFDKERARIDELKQRSPVTTRYASVSDNAR